MNFGLLFNKLENSGDSKGVRSKVNKELKSLNFTNPQIRTARACLNNTILNLNEDLDENIIKFYKYKYKNENKNDDFTHNINDNLNSKIETFNEMDETYNFNEITEILNTYFEIKKKIGVVDNKLRNTIISRSRDI